MLAARPVATSIISARSSAGSFPSGPTITQMPFVVRGDGRGIEARVGHDRHAALGEAALEQLADLGVLERDDLRQVLEQGHLDPDVGEHAGEFDADRAGPDDDDVLRQGVHLEDVVARHDALAVGRQARQRLDPRAGGDDDVRGVQDAVAAGARRAVLARLADLDLARTVEPSAAGDPGHLVLVDEGLEPGPQALDHGVAPGGHRRVVDDRRRPARTTP